MKCRVCGGSDGQVIYSGRMRMGGRRYLESCKVYRCNKCSHIYHNEFEVEEHYYESTQYRDEVDGSSEVADFYRMFDEATLMKLEWTGTARFRDKVVLDIGCAGGMFLDYVKGIAKETIAVEPAEVFRNELQKRHEVYPYVKQLLEQGGGKIDIACSFDVIEHVEDVNTFVKEIHESLKQGGEVIIGTPTIATAYQDTLGEIWDAFNFRTQHLSVFTLDSLKYLFESNGFTDIVIKNIQRYDLGNLLAWCLYKEPKGNLRFPWISDTLNAVFKEELAANGAGDYLILYGRK